MRHRRLGPFAPPCQLATETGVEPEQPVDAHRHRSVAPKAHQRPVDGQLCQVVGEQSLVVAAVHRLGIEWHTCGVQLVAQLAHVCYLLGCPGQRFREGCVQRSTRSGRCSAARHAEVRQQQCEAVGRQVRQARGQAWRDDERGAHAAAAHGVHGHAHHHAHAHQHAAAVALRHLMHLCVLAGFRHRG
eukprot:4266069-Prymnesium_polylepis.1